MKEDRRTMDRQEYSHRYLFPLIALLAGLMLVACGSQTDVQTSIVEVAGGDPARGREAIVEYGCHSCHAIPGIREANAYAAPPLAHYAKRSFVGGVAPNTSDNLILWIQNPQAINPMSGMPALGVTEEDARNIAAYLYTLE